MRFEKALLIISAFFSDALMCVAFSRDSRPIDPNNGRLITIAEAPYIVQLMIISSNGWFYCVGTLLTPLHVITVAQCFDHVSPQDVLVVGGATTTYEDGVQRRIINLRRSRFYSPQTLNMDVAVLKLDRPMWGKNIETLPLCTKAWKSGDLLQVSGWEKTNITFPGAELLRSFRLPMVSHGECATWHGSGDITDTMECVYGPDSEGCSIIAGSPAVNEEGLCAIFSWSRGCKENEYPGVYTSVYKVRDFVEAALKM